MKESALNAKIQAYLKSQGCYVIKTIATNKAGTPDILACYKGRFIGIEGKLDYNKPSALQLAHIEMVKAAGGLATTAYNIDQVKSLIMECDS